MLQVLSIDKELHKLLFSCLQENEVRLQQVKEEAASAQRQYEQRREEQVGYGGDAEREEGQGREGGERKGEREGSGNSNSLSLGVDVYSRIVWGEGVWREECM